MAAQVEEQEDEEEEEEEMKRVPVTVLTGFLGSGKTTLLNHILKSREHGMRFAIIENEFGEVGVDEKVITEATEEEIIEVINGCICCTVRGDLTQALKRMYEKVDGFDAVIIETTGLADPAPVAQTFFVDDDIKEMYSLDGIVTVVDAKHIAQHLDEEKPEGVENESVEQVAFADRILLNKIDLVSDAELDAIEDKIKKINANAPIVRCQHSQVDPKSLLYMGAFSVDRVLNMDPEFLNVDGDHQHDPSVSSCSWRVKGELNEHKLQKWFCDIVGEKGTDLFRYKGVMACRGYEEKYIFQGVHMIFTGLFSDVKWKPDEPRECRIVFIGRNLDKKELLNGVMAAMAEDNLRFKLGDEVECKVGKWKRGKVIKIWDEAYPYKIALNSGSCCWAPEDSDDFIRPPSGTSEPNKKGKGKRQEKGAGGKASGSRKNQGASARESGTVATWLNHKGIGFITPDDGGDDYLVHFSEVNADSESGFVTLGVGERVEYDLKPDGKNTAKFLAVNVTGPGGVPVLGKGRQKGRGKGEGKDPGRATEKGAGQFSGKSKGKGSRKGTGKSSGKSWQKKES